MDSSNRYRVSGISKLGRAENQRDPDVPHRFAESIVTLGEFKMAYKLKLHKNCSGAITLNLKIILYLCQQSKPSRNLCLKKMAFNYLCKQRRKTPWLKMKILHPYWPLKRKLVPSDGYMFGTQWNNRNEPSPLKLKEKSVRRHHFNRLKPAIQNDPVKLNKEVEKANLQTVDSCALETEQDTLELHFTLKVLGGIHQPSACNNAAFKQSYSMAAKAYVEKERFRELARRYALNIANARFLWRNRGCGKY